MNLSLYTIGRNTVFTWYFFIIAINFFIGLFFWGIGLDALGFGYHVLSAEVGGIVQATTVLIALFIFNPKKQAGRFAVIFLFVFIGTLIADLLSINSREQFLINLLFGTLIGSTIFGSAFYWETMAINQSNLNKEKIHRLRMEKKATEARLRILQAQMEPHFLFNTLSNILNLFDTDIRTGKSMQIDLIRYLESSLEKIRKEHATIEEEMELVTAYLNIFKVRMGSRLKFSTEVPDNLKQVLIPSMMIQPLVENSIKHGIEPKIEGGEIRVKIESTGDILRIIVDDTGLGMDEAGRIGTGVSNIQERLNLIYGEKGRLTLTENKPSGLKAIIEVPYERQQGGHRR